MSEALRWLETRRPACPQPLLREIAGILEAESGGRPVPETLAGAALAALPRVAGAASRRDGALPLLAVDALLTYACEAAAEAGLDALEPLLDALGPERFAAALAAMEDS